MALINMLKYTITTEERISQFLKMPYNPPVFTETYTDDDFMSEYWRTRESIEKSLGIIAKYQGDYDDLDFTINDDIIYSRGISIEMNSPKLINKKFINIVNKCLLNEVNDYSVYIDHDMLDMDDFCLFIVKNEAFGASDNQDIFKRFGFVINADE